MSLTGKQISLNYIEIRKRVSDFWLNKANESNFERCRHVWRRITELKFQGQQGQQSMHIKEFAFTSLHY